MLSLNDAKLFCLSRAQNESALLQSLSKKVREADRMRMVLVFSHVLKIHDLDDLNLCGYDVFCLGCFVWYRPNAGKKCTNIDRPDHPALIRQHNAQAMQII